MDRSKLTPEQLEAVKAADEQYRATKAQALKDHTDGYRFGLAMAEARRVRCEAYEAIVGPPKGGM